MTEGASQCENYAGGSRCPSTATHQIRLSLDDGEYESALCSACFEGFRSEMIKKGLPPRNESAT